MHHHTTRIHTRTHEHTNTRTEEVFSEARSLLFKTIRVRRVYDKEANAIIYVSYSTRLTKNDDDNKSRFKSSLCAVPLDGEQVEIIQ